MRSFLLFLAYFSATLAAAADPIDFPELVRIAERYELPRPPANAQLVLASTGATTSGGSEKVPNPGMYRPAFLLEQLPEGRARVLMGWRETEAASSGEFRPAIHTYSLSERDADRGEYALWCYDASSFVTAVQLAQRGERDLAIELWREIRDAEGFDDHDIFDGGSLLPDAPDDLLACCVFQFYYESCLKTNADLKQFDAKLSRLRREFPSLFSRNNRDYHQYRRTQFLRSLRATARAKPPHDGSVESLLIKWGSEDKDRYFPDLYEQQSDADDSARKILSMGVKAIPELARLVNDPRLTHKTIGGFGGPEEIVRIGELANRLLEALCGSQDPRIVVLQLGKAPADREFFELAAVTVKDNKISKFHEVPLWILANKHPASLLTFCKRAASDATPDTSLYDLAESMVRAKLTHDEKTKALVDLCDSQQDYSGKREVLQNLAELDQNRCIALLHPVLGSLPSDVDRRYWTCEAANYTHVVMQLEDDQIWSEYLGVAKRAAVGLRMEMMEPMSHSCCCGDKNKARRLAFLAAFLDDAAVRDQSVDEEKFDGPCAAFTFQKIEVRNCAAMDIAALLELDDCPNESWGDDRWAELRAKVQAALQKVTLPKLAE